MVNYQSSWCDTKEEEAQSAKLDSLFLFFFFLTLGPFTQPVEGGNIVPSFRSCSIYFLKSWNPEQLVVTTLKCLNCSVSFLTIIFHYPVQDRHTSEHFRSHCLSASACFPTWLRFSGGTNTPLGDSACFYGVVSMCAASKSTSAPGRPAVIVVKKITLCLEYS